MKPWNGPRPHYFASRRKKIQAGGRPRPTNVLTLLFFFKTEVFKYCTVFHVTSNDIDNIDHLDIKVRLTIASRRCINRKYLSITLSRIHKALKYFPFLPKFPIFFCKRIWSTFLVMLAIFKIQSWSNECQCPVKRVEYYFEIVHIYSGNTFVYF
jgi:hypothetical protein